MKLIISSSVLRDAIKQAFDVDAHYIKSYVEISGHGTLTFGTTKYQSDISVSCDFREHNSEVVHFNNLAMANLYNFLKMLREQPIVVIFDFETVRVEQCVIDFI